MNDSGISPLEYKVVIRLDPVEEVRKSGLIIPTAKKERDELEADEGTLVAVSPHAFSYAEWPEGARKPVVGDRVLFARFDGVLIERNGAKWRIVNDKSVIGLLAPQPALQAVA